MANLKRKVIATIKHVVDKCVNYEYFIAWGEVMKFYSPKAAIELFHLVLLDILGRKVDKKHYALKGGSNLRFFFKSFRYSEDMDLDVSSELSKDKLQDSMNRILESKTIEQILDVKGIRMQHKSSPKPTDTTQQWKFAISAPGSNVLLRTKIEFSRSGKFTDMAFDSVDANLIRTYGLPPILASHYKLEDAYLQKVVALATRREIQARDVFDIHLLLASGVETTVVCEETAKIVDKARENACAVSYDMFKSQVVSYLHPDYQAQYSSPELWDKIVLTVEGALEGINR
ncbi:MAG: nucleotidyl transferase AbiEii/AbiGii toxin family protein [Candidatus Aminicenantes bacterium]|nr:nucleotidyl transferase AbiEii/AbiGii toxin family protein [Acidobacteriota bacterium]MCG2815573.1 nucleotidyl transferase AbiEii/AbiGii toxin family protein [Candidatus Aminicenantes bacterium]